MSFHIGMGEGSIVYTTQWNADVARVRLALFLWLGVRGRSYSTFLASTIPVTTTTYSSEVFTPKLKGLAWAS